MSGKHVGGNALMSLDQPVKKLRGFGEVEQPLKPVPPVESKPSVVASAETTPPTTQPPTTHHPSTNHPPTNHPTAPARNFARVYNSIALSAIPAGLFRGESKKLYDALYQRTRGAVTPQRAIRATHADLMRWAKISHNTLKAHIRYLSETGLLVVHYRRGDSGADYEVFVPEEIEQDTHQPLTNHPPTTQPPTASQNLTPTTHQNLALGGGSKVVDSKDTSGVPKTFTSDKDRSDDEPLTRALREAERELTGKASAPDAWRELAELLVAELRIAAARTDSVSSVPAFLTEHLRRRLWKKDKAQLEREEKAAGGESQPEVDVSKCTACGGSGWHYPEGPERGVARCKHEALHAGVNLQNS